MAFIEIEGWDNWVNEFKPIKNHITKYPDPNAEYGAFETYGDELEYVRSVMPEHRVWTRVQGDMCDLIVSGYSYVNRLEYYITEKPYNPDDDYQVLLSVEVECDCYKEEGYGPYTLPNGHEYYEDGDRNCTICEGYGLKTEYVG